VLQVGKISATIPAIIDSIPVTNKTTQHFNYAVVWDAIVKNAKFLIRCKNNPLLIQVKDHAG
jgi:hypothetical protein